MSAPVDVLAVMDRDAADADAHRSHLTIEPIDEAGLPESRRSESAEARAAVEDLIAERDRLSRIACSHAAQILRMRDERDELMLAAENALGNLTTAGTPRPIKGKERAHAMLTAALARCKGGSA